jgi:streptomycin 6-kinase
MIEISEVVRNKARAVGATAWLDALPTLVGELEWCWSITVGPAYPDATEAYVAAAELADGTSAVLKLVVPRTGSHAQHEITVLRVADGDGCARLLRHDADRGALLLERLGPSLYELGRPVERRHEILTDLARRVWRPAAGRGLPTGADKARWLAEFVTTTWDDADRPCTEAAIEHAVVCAERRAAAHDDERAVLVHGDVHQWNALTRKGDFALVDPDGLLAEPEYDLGVIMREDPVELLPAPHRRTRWLAARTGLDALAIWEWGVVERVATGLLGTVVGLQPVAAQMLAAADHIAARPDLRDLRPG